MHRKKRVNVTFVFRVVCLSPMLRALYCSDFDIIKIPSKMNFLSHSIANIIQQHPSFVNCRNI